MLRTNGAQHPQPALVDPIQFSGAVADLVSQLRSLDTDGEVIVQSVEQVSSLRLPCPATGTHPALHFRPPQVRQLAKEARGVIVAASYSTEIIEEFSDALQPVFMP